MRVAGLGFAFKGLYTAMLSGGVPGFLLRIRGNEKKRIRADKKASDDLHFSWRLLFCPAFVSVILIAI